jgi:hypothetical protein
MAISASCVIGIVAIRAQHRARIARLRHDLYLKMLESGKVSKEEMEEMLHGIGGGSRAIRAAPAENAPVGGFFRFVVGIGWLGVMTAIGLLVGSMFADSGDRSGMALAAAIVGAVSLGLVGLPIGLRELTGRGAGSQKVTG